MKIHFKILTTLHDAIVSDLRRCHEHAAERVGFISCKFGSTNHGLLVLAAKYFPVADDHYEPDLRVGARMNSSAIRAALQIALTEDAGIFHVHMHDHCTGLPQPSSTDWTEWNKFVPNFWHVRPDLPHGTLIFGVNRISGWCWYPGHTEPFLIERFSLVGRPLESWRVR